MGDPSGEGDVWDNCVANSGCAYTEAKKCHSSAKDVLVTRHNCATQLADASGAYAAYSTCLKDSRPFARLTLTKWVKLTLNAKKDLLVVRGALTVCSSSLLRM